MPQPDCFFQVVGFLLRKNPQKPRARFAFVWEKGLKSGKTLDFSEIRVILNYS